MEEPRSSPDSKRYCTFLTKVQTKCQFTLVTFFLLKDGLWILHFLVWGNGELHGDVIVSTM